MNPYAIRISDEHSFDTKDPGVPKVIYLSVADHSAPLQGSKMVDTSGVEHYVFQYYTGNSFKHYVAMLSWEDWGNERCPRFAVYAFDGWEGDVGIYYLCQDVADTLDWPKH